MTETLKVKPESSSCIPVRKTAKSAGIDVYVNNDDFTIAPGEIKKVSFGFTAAIPDGHVGIMAIRSGHGAKGLVLANAIGVIDQDYRGDWMANLINNNPHEPIYISRYERVAQVLIVPVSYCDIEVVEELDETERGAGGFGSTGA